MSNDYTSRYLDEAIQICDRLDQTKIEAIVEILEGVRERGGRLFFVGVGGSAGNASHAVNDFRKIAGMECYTPTDNVSELTARINDDGWEGVFASWLKVSRIGKDDALFIFSVGGGNLEKKISVNIVSALELAANKGAKIVGVVGRDGGHTARLADACVIVPTISADTITPLTEAFQAVVWHLLVSHPRLKKNEMKWEGTR